MGDLLGDAHAPEWWIATLDFDDCRDEFGGRAVGARLAPRRRRTE